MILYISEDQKQVIFGYSSEPILADAAAYYWQLLARKDTIFVSAIENVTKCIREGIVKKDDLLVARLILLKAMDTAVLVKNKTKTNKLKNRFIIYLNKFKKIFFFFNKGQKITIRFKIYEMGDR